MQHEELLIVEAGGTYSYQWALPFELTAVGVMEDIGTSHVVTVDPNS
jgi:hypothetical protein